MEGTPLDQQQAQLDKAERYERCASGFDGTGVVDDLANLSLLAEFKALADAEIVPKTVDNQVL